MDTYIKKVDIGEIFGNIMRKRGLENDISF